ncbi:MAG: hypothetical protein ACK5HY_01185 [Parahaliea sp.]
MDKELEKQEGQAAEQEGTAAGMGESGIVSSQSRRQFAHRAAIGSAVMLTLGNRSAWAQSDRLCVSQYVWESYVNNPGMASSAPTQDQADEVRAFEDYLRGDPDATPELVPGEGYCVNVAPGDEGSGHGRNFLEGADSVEAGNLTTQPGQPGRAGISYDIDY